MTGNRWNLLVGGLVLGAFVVRLIIIALYRRGGTDLQIFYYFSNLVRGGHDPYHSPAHGPIDPIHGDDPPFEYGAMALLLAIHNSRDTLRVASAFIEAATVLIILLRAPRSRTWRLSVASFVAFNPFTLIDWTAFFEDKGAMFFCLVIILIALERGRIMMSWVMSLVLAILKWLIVFAPALVIHTYSRLGKRATAVYFVGSLFFYALSYLLFFPSNLRAYSRRSDHVGVAPYHASLSTFLWRAHLYSPIFVRIVVPVSLLLIYLAYLRRHIDVRETIVLSVLASFVFLPDNATHRVALTTLPFLFILRLTPARMALIWGAALLGSVAEVVARYGVPILHRGTVVADAISRLFGTGLGSLGYVFFGNALTFVMLALFARDKWCARKTHHRSTLPTRRVATASSGGPS
jgi:hypothetical protein